MLLKTFQFVFGEFSSGFGSQHRYAVADRIGKASGTAEKFGAVVRDVERRLGQRANEEFQEPWRGYVLLSPGGVVVLVPVLIVALALLGTIPTPLGVFVLGGPGHCS